LTRKFFDPSTRQAVLQFQKNNSLAMSGAIDAETARKMRIATPKVVLVGRERQPIGIRVSDKNTMN
jgi:peptidoglycan hydrolase-like protein with peptidoglycan-binding domain